MKRDDGKKLRRTTDAEIAFIREHWATSTSVEIAAAIGVRVGTVKSWASRMKLGKQPDVLSQLRTDAVNRRGIGPGSRPRKPTPLGSHLRLLLGKQPVALPAALGRVHLIEDDGRIAA